MHPCGLHFRLSGTNWLAILEMIMSKYQILKPVSGKTEMPFILFMHGLFLLTALDFSRHP